MKLLTISLLFSLSLNIILGYTFLSSKNTQPPGIKTFNRQLELTEKEYHAIATHEAGHAMMLGLLDQIPEYCEVLIPNKRGEIITLSTNSGGYVLGATNTNYIASANQLLYEMSNSKAGMIAEKEFNFISHDIHDFLRLKKNALYDREDFHKLFDKYVKTYDYDKKYYETLNRIRIIENHDPYFVFTQNLEKELKHYFRENETIFHSLVKEIKEKSYLNSQDLKRILKNVKKNKKIPVPLEHEITHIFQVKN